MNNENGRPKQVGKRAGRFKELHQLRRHRWPHGLSGELRGKEAPRVLAFLRVCALSGLDMQVLKQEWIPASLKLPELDALVEMSKEAIAKETMISAEDAGNVLRLTKAERKTLKIRTIRSMGMDDHSMQEKRKMDRRKASRKHRSKAGARRRMSWDIDGQKPWDLVPEVRRTRFFEMTRKEQLQVFEKAKEIASKTPDSTSPIYIKTPYSGHAGVTQTVPVNPLPSVQDREPVSVTTGPIKNERPGTLH